MDRHNRNNNRHYTQHPCKHRLCKNLQFVLQKTEYVVAEIQPWTYITEIAIDITLNPPISTNYAENPEFVRRKTEYVATKIEPMDIHHRNSNRYIVFLWV